MLFLVLYSTEKMKGNIIEYIPMMLWLSFNLYASLIDHIVAIFHTLLQNIETLSCIHFPAYRIYQTSVYSNYHILLFLLDFKSKVRFTSNVSTYTLELFVFVYWCSILFERPLRTFICFISPLLIMLTRVVVPILYLHTHLSYLFWVFAIMEYFTILVRFIYNYTYTVCMKSLTMFSVDMHLLHHYGRNFAHLSYFYSLVIGLYKSERWAGKKMKD